jgi:hypothetical protein
MGIRGKTGKRPPRPTRGKFAGAVEGAIGKAFGFFNKERPGK